MEVPPREEIVWPRYDQLDAAEREAFLAVSTGSTIPDPESFYPWDYLKFRALRERGL